MCVCMCVCVCVSDLRELTPELLYCLIVLLFRVAGVSNGALCGGIVRLLFGSGNGRRPTCLPVSLSAFV